MSSLIVDFPARRRRGSRAGARSVRFSPVSQLALFRGREESAHKLYYSRSEYEAMKAAQSTDLRDVRESYLSPEARASFGMPDFTGLENLLTQELYRKVLSNKSRRRRAVLAEQAGQRELGECNPDKISLASRRFSDWSTRRARKVGAFTAEQVKEMK